MYQPNKSGPSIRTILIILVACLLASIQQGIGQAVLPLKPNQLVMTCFSGTSNNAVIPDPDNYVIGFMDTRDPLGDGATLGSNWVPPVGWAFHNETSTDEWTAANLGEVFGVTLDDAPAPNIYTSASTVYGDFPPGPGGHGAVYRLDGTTGNISFLTIPGIGKASLGNLCHWKSSNGTSWLYVTSFEDGLIYRINVDTWTVEAVTYDHGVDGRTAASMAPIPDDGTMDTMTALGRRVWGVKAFQGRLYYGVWWEDKVNPSSSLANEIWSVALDPVTGQFLPATAILEANLPPRNVFSNYSLPVASIDFSPAGMMLLAERYYRWDGVHQARVLSYVGTSGSWTANPTDQYRVGNSSILAAGGVVADCEENVWATGDILNGNIYGVQRIPAGGNATDSPATANSILIDIDGDIVAQDKTLIGALAIWNDCDCMLVENVEIDCPVEEGGPYSVGFDITNQSGETVQWVLITPDTGVTGIIPNNIPLSPGLANGDSISLTDIQMLGAVPGTEICFNVTLLSLKQGQLEECCTKKVRVRVPECGCVELEVTSVDCSQIQADGTVVAKVCFDVTNQGTDDLYYIYALPDPSSGWTVTPSFVELTPPLAPGETQEVCYEINGVQPGHTAKLPLTFHNDAMQTCCLRTLCFEVPQKDDPHEEGICCWLPEVVYCCPNKPGAKALLVICNKSNQDREIAWNIQIPPATPDCPIILDPALDFTPSNGVVAVPAGECIEVPIELSCEKLMQGQLPCAWWGVGLTDVETGEKSFCRSQLKFSDDPTVKHIGNGNPENISPNLVNARVGIPVNVGFVVENQTEETAQFQLVATETSRLLGFKQGNDAMSNIWNKEINLAPGDKQVIRITMDWKSDHLDLSNVHGLATLNLFLRKIGSPTQTAAMVPIHLTAQTQGKGRPNLRSVTLETPAGMNPCIKLECTEPFQTSMIVEASQGLNDDWKQIPFSTEMGAPMNQWSVSSESVATSSVYVALDGDCCFYRVRKVTEE